MSANFAVRSFGAPYFALVQDNLSGMDAGGLRSLGLAYVRVEVRVYALPVQYAADDEIHPLFSLHEYGGSGQILHEVGITPSGAVASIVKNGAAATSFPARILPDGTWHTIESLYDTATGDLALLLDGEEVASDSDGGGSLAPSASRIARIVLFNGMLGISRADCAIRSVYASTADASTGYAIGWSLAARGENPASASSADFPNIDASLTPGWYDPLVWPALYGAVPVGDPGDAYRWQVDTEWSLVNRDPTTWTKVVSA